MDRFAKSINLAYFKVKRKVEIPKKWILLRRVGREKLSFSGQLKLEWIIFYYTTANQNATLTALNFGISRKTFHKWLSKFDEINLTTLEEQSRTPKHKRDWMVSLQEEERIINLRKENMEFGKRKLKRIYFRKYGEGISTWKIERVIRKHKLYLDPVKHDKIVEKRKRSEPKIRIHEVKDQIKQIKEFGFLWHIDAIIIWWYGQKRIIFTALE